MQVARITIPSGKYIIFATASTDKSIKDSQMSLDVSYDTGTFNTFYIKGVKCSMENGGGCSTSGFVDCSTETTLVTLSYGYYDAAQYNITHLLQAIRIG